MSEFNGMTRQMNPDVLGRAQAKLRANGWDTYESDGALVCPVDDPGGESTEASRREIVRILGPDYRVGWSGESNTDADGDTTSDLLIEQVQISTADKIIAIEQAVEAGQKRVLDAVDALAKAHRVLQRDRKLLERLRQRQHLERLGVDVKTDGRDESGNAAQERWYRHCDEVDS